jgi:hypothetical protein
MKKFRVTNRIIAIVAVLALLITVFDCNAVTAYDIGAPINPTETATEYETTEREEPIIFIMIPDPITHLDQQDDGIRLRHKKSQQVFEILFRSRLRTSVAIR